LHIIKIYIKVFHPLSIQENDGLLTISPIMSMGISTKKAGTVVRKCCQEQSKTKMNAVSKRGVCLYKSTVFLPVINKGENIMFHLIDGYSIKGSSFLF
jgi:hypothetical protein